MNKLDHTPRSQSPRTRGVRGPVRALGALGVGAASATGGILAFAGAAHADPATHAKTTNAVTYSFNTVDNSNDLTFNQLLGINDQGVIAGYFGSGMAGHPNKGYYLISGGRFSPGYNQLGYRVENFPASVQTQVTGLNDHGTEVGFYSPTNTGTDANYAWYSTDNGLSFHAVTVSGVSFGTPPVTQLLGVNDSNEAVGFYTDSNSNNHGFLYDIRTGRFSFTNISGVSSATDTAINNRGQIAGFFTSSSGVVESFIQTSEHHVHAFSYPGAASTQALGVNDAGEVVGVYTVGSGSSALMHGFTWTQTGGFQTVDDSNGIGTTTINGINDRGDLVGFYTDSAGNTDGFVATPSS